MNKHYDQASDVSKQPDRPLILLLFIEFPERMKFHSNISYDDISLNLIICSVESFYSSRVSNILEKISLAILPLFET